MYKYQYTKFTPKAVLQQEKSTSQRNIYHFTILKYLQLLYYNTEYKLCLCVRAITNIEKASESNIDINDQTSEGDKLATYSNVIDVVLSPFLNPSLIWETFGSIFICPSTQCIFDKADIASGGYTYENATILR